MKTAMLGVVVAVAVGLAGAPALAKGGGKGGSHGVKGYTTKNGTYVAPHRATNPNRSKLDNWSTKGNVNPYNGRPGTVDPFAPPGAK